MQNGTGVDQVPFELQVDVFEPISVKPGSQTNVAIEPAIGRLSVLFDVAPVTVPFVKVAIAMQVAKRRKLSHWLKFVKLLSTGAWCKRPIPVSICLAEIVGRNSVYSREKIVCDTLERICEERIERRRRNHSASRIIGKNVRADVH